MINYNKNLGKEKCCFEILTKEKYKTCKYCANYDDKNGEIIDNSKCFNIKKWNYKEETIKKK